MRFLCLLACLGLAAASALPAPAAAQSRFFTFERNIDRPGRDIMPGAPSPDAAACSFACQASNQCRAFTFVRPGIQGPFGMCWLKNAVPRAVRNTCCTSGVRRGAPVRID
jgi:PAN domain